MITFLWNGMCYNVFFSTISFLFFGALTEKENVIFFVDRKRLSSTSIENSKFAD